MNKTRSFLNSIWQEFIYGSHLLILGTSGVIFTSAFLLDIPITLNFLLAVYLIFYVIYSYNRLKEFKSDFLTNPSRTQHIKKYINHLPFIIFCSTLTVVFLLMHSGNFWNLIFGFSILLSGVFYTKYFKKITKKIAGFKSFYASFVWALLVLFLSFYYSLPLNLPVFLIFTFVFLRLLTNTIFSDIKDIELDKKDNLKTIPILFGKKKTLSYLHILNIFSFVPIVVGVFMNLLPLFSLILLIFYLYSLFYLKMIGYKKTDVCRLSYVMVDGEYALWPIVLFLSKLTIIV